MLLVSADYRFLLGAFRFVDELWMHELGLTSGVATGVVRVTFVWGGYLRGAEAG